MFIFDEARLSLGFVDDKMSPCAKTGTELCTFFLDHFGSVCGNFLSVFGNFGFVSFSFSL